MQKRSTSLALLATVLALVALFFTIHLSKNDFSVAQVAPAEQDCEFRTVDGILKICCRVPYSTSYRCREFAGSFNNLCAQKGMQCQYVEIYCPDGKGHAVAIAVIDGQECLVETEKSDVASAIISCDIDTQEKLDAAACSAMQKAPGCKCTVVKKGPKPPPAGPLFCAMIKEGLEACKICCDDQERRIPDTPGGMFYPGYLKECYEACEKYTPFPFCDTCKKGYLSDGCNLTTCEEPYNTGRCNGRKQCVIAKDMPCASPGLCKEWNRSSAATSNSSRRSSVSRDLP